MYIDSSVAVIVVTVANNVVTLASQPAQPGETLVLMVVNNTELSTYPQDTDLPRVATIRILSSFFLQQTGKQEAPYPPPSPQLEIQY